MNTTSVGLLERLKYAKSDNPEWGRLQGIYQPLIRSWLVSIPGVGDEIQDLTQEVMLVLYRELPGFERRRDGAFRAWLRQITVNRLRAFYKTHRYHPKAGHRQDADTILDQLEDPNGDLAAQWDRDHDREVCRGLLALVQPDFEAITWQAFTKFALEGLPATLVAQELGLSENAVVQAKFRILKRLREETTDLLD